MKWHLVKRAQLFKITGRQTLPVFHVPPVFCPKPLAPPLKGFAVAVLPKPVAFVVVAPKPADVKASDELTSKDLPQRDMEEILTNQMCCCSCSQILQSQWKWNYCYCRN